MKILYIIHSLIIGGAETVVANYVLNLKKRGEDVALLELSHTETFLAKMIRDNDIPYFTLFDDRWYKKIIRRVNYRYTITLFNKALKEIKPDVIHFHTMFNGMDQIDFPFNRCVFTYHSRVKRNFMSAQYIKPLMDSLVNKGIMLVAISSEIDNDIKKYFKEAKSVVIPNGLDLDAIRKNRISKETLCEELKLPQDGFLIGQVGRFNPVKNHGFTLELFKQISEDYPNSYLLFIGTGNSQELKTIKSRIQELNLADHVKLLGLRSDATAVMSCFDVLLMPSKSEALPLVMIEAQALGIRCVASDAIPEDVICNPNCFRLPLETSLKEWENYVVGRTEVCKDRELLNFEIETVIKKHVKLYNLLINGNC